jgi:hypothetical protein
MLDRLLFALGVTARTLLWSLALLGILAGLCLGTPLAEFRYVNF